MSLSRTFFQNIYAEDKSKDDEEWEGDSQDSKGFHNAINSNDIDLYKLLAPAEEYLEDVLRKDSDCYADSVYSLDIHFLTEFILTQFKTPGRVTVVLLKLQNQKWR